MAGLYAHAQKYAEPIAAVLEPLVAAKKEFDTAEERAKREAAAAEERRVTEISNRIALIESLPGKAATMGIATLQLKIKDLDEETFEWAQEYSMKAATTRNSVAESLRAMLKMKQDQEELAELRQAAAKKEREEAEAKAIKQESANATKRRTMAEQYILDALREYQGLPLATTAVKIVESIVNGEAPYIKYEG